MLRNLAKRLAQPAGARLFATQTEVGVVSGLPPLEAGRKVTIYSPARTAGQQGLNGTAAGARRRRPPPPLPRRCRF